MGTEEGSLLVLRLAFLHPDGIPEEMFIEGAPELGPVLGPVGSDAFGLNSSISEILKYSLLRRDPNARIQCCLCGPSAAHPAAPRARL